MKSVSHSGFKDLKSWVSWEPVARSPQRRWSEVQKRRSSNLKWEWRLTPNIRRFIEVRSSSMKHLWRLIMVNFISIIGGHETSTNFGSTRRVIWCKSAEGDCKIDLRMAMSLAVAVRALILVLTSLVWQWTWTWVSVSLKNAVGQLGLSQLAPAPSHPL